MVFCGLVCGVLWWFVVFCGVLWCLVPPIYPAHKLVCVLGVLEWLFIYRNDLKFMDR